MLGRHPWAHRCPSVLGIDALVVDGRVETGWRVGSPVWSSPGALILGWSVALPLRALAPPIVHCLGLVVVGCEADFSPSHPTQIFEFPTKGSSYFVQCQLLGKSIFAGSSEWVLVFGVKRRAGREGGTDGGTDGRTDGRTRTPPQLYPLEGTYTELTELLT